MCNVEAMSPQALEAQVIQGLGGRWAREAARFRASALDFAEPSALKCLALELR
jgi:hypothetical protein